MRTRKDYLNGDCTHSEYYDQFVTDLTISSVISRFSIERLKGCDKHFNHIPLKEWDDLAAYTPIKGIFKELGDYCTKSSLVCIMKEAARQAISK